MPPMVLEGCMEKENMVEVPGRPLRWWLPCMLNPRKWKNDQSLMSKRSKIEVAAKFVEEWTLPPAATFGSSVRAKGSS